MSIHFIEFIDDALQAVREAQQLPVSFTSIRLLKEAENALHGAAKVWLAAQPSASVQTPRVAFTTLKQGTEDLARVIRFELKRHEAEQLRATSNRYEALIPLSTDDESCREFNEQARNFGRMAMVAEELAAELERDL